MIAPDELRSILRMWASGVTLVTAAHDGAMHGMTVSSFSSVALEPPLISVNIERRTRTHQLMEQAGCFAVCVLAEQQEPLARRFGGGLRDDAERFDDLDFSLGKLGAPVPEGCLAVMECEIVGAHPAGTHTVFIGQVMRAARSDRHAPLIYFNRKYRGLADAG